METHPKIPYLKGKPKNILPLLLTIRKHQFEDNKQEIIENELVKVIDADATSIRKDNLVWSRIRPPLISLGLIEDRKKIYNLTPLGKVVINHIRDEDYDFHRKYLRKPEFSDQFKKKVGKILIDIDRDKAKVLDTLQMIQKVQMEFVNTADLMIELKKRNINPCQKVKEDKINEQLYKKLKDAGLLEKEFNEGSRLNELLRYYDYFNLVIYRGDEVSLNKIKISSLQGVKLLMSSNDITDDEFFKALLSAYNRSIKKSLGSYVPIIPDIQRLVTYDLETTNEVFKEKIGKFPASFKNKQILLAPSREAKPEELIIKKGRVRFYYISISISTKGDENGK